MMRKLATDQAGLEILHLADCFRLLGSVPVGRIAFVAGGEAAIAPVNFGVDGQDIVFRTGTGSRLATLEVGRYVQFEADAYDAAARTGWSVVASGLAEVVASGAECTRLDTLGLRPWGGAAADRTWVRIRPVSISGRHIVAAENWE